MKEDRLWMDATDRKRLYIIKQIIEKRITQKKAAEILGLSSRHVRRLSRRVSREGDRGVIHRNRGRSSNHRLDEKLKQRVLELYPKKYLGFGPTFAVEQLAKREKIRISRETLRGWLQEAELLYKKRRGRAHRQWRARKECFGEMLQMDGSHHDWLEGRGPKLVLMGYVDDATSRAYARFYDYEGTLPAFDGLARYIQKHGIPCSVYLDRLSAYKSVRKLLLEEELEGLDMPKSQFQRAMNELGVELIHANSPQAKGRVERFFGTLQDRLVKEMRMAGICSLEDANSFLGHYLVEHNKKFAVPAAKDVDLHRPLSTKKFLDSILSIKTKRFLRNDFTIVHAGKLYQIKEPICARKVMVEQRIDGSLHLFHNGRNLQFQQISQPPAKIVQNYDGPGKGNHYRRKPRLTHPWRRYKNNSVPKKTAVNGHRS